MSSLCLATLMLPGSAADDLPPYYFTTLAGQASRGSTDGTGNAARFCEPSGGAVDRDGNVYVADTSNHTIRRITPAGVVTTLAGTAGSPGSTDGTGSAARFNQPRGVAADASGNILVADSGNHLIRRITPAGVVTTLAGSAGLAGATDGTGTAARFNRPANVALGVAGDILVADTGNQVIRQISSAGVVTTFAGTAGTSGWVDGAASSARFFEPTGLAVDAAGSVYVADSGNFVVRKITLPGVVSTLAGTPNSPGSGDGLGAAARFFAPQAVAVDALGNVFVADLFNCTVRKITPAGQVTTLAGSAGDMNWTDGTTANARFGYLSGVALDGTGAVYAVDLWHNSVRKITAAGVVTTLAGNGDSIGSADGPGAVARFHYPAGVAVDTAGNIYVADRFNCVIRRITSAGVTATLAGLAGNPGSVDGTGSAARFYYPQGIAVDSAGNVYASEPAKHTIRKITAAGVVTTFAGSTDLRGSANGTGASARFDTPFGLAVDAADNVYVADRNNDLIRRITPAGVVSTVVAPPPIVGTEVRSLAGPEGVAVDKSGNLYVADYYNCTIRRVTPAGVVTTLAGLAGVSGTADGTGSEARFDHPSSLAVDDAGNVYVVDTIHNTFRRVTPAGVVTTLAGSAEGIGSSNDGLGNSVRFFSPSSVALNSSGFAYVADTQNNTIRQGQLASKPVTVAQPRSLSVASGASVQFSVTAAAVPAPAYQWYFNDAPFQGATASTLSFPNARAADAGEYSVVVSNPLGSVTSAKATLTVTGTPSNPAPSSGNGGTGGSGGGGAPSAWFLLALLTASAARFVRRNRLFP